MTKTGQHGKVRHREPWEITALGELRDRHRFDEFVRCAYARMLSLARQLLGNPDDASDVAQKVFLELHEVVTQHLSEPQAIAVKFLYDRVRWRVYDHIRDRQRQPFVSTEARGTSDSNDSSSNEENVLSASTCDTSESEVETIVVAIEKSKDIHEMVKELGGRRREVFDLLTKGERPVDIARQLGITKARVSQLMQIVCAQLKTKLRDNGWECHETIGVPLNFSRKHTLD
jgi:RNA polymerase sigma factor (sigma-70 family)